MPAIGNFRKILAGMQHQRPEMLSGSRPFHFYILF
jgi:hypothetical protein